MEPADNRAPRSPLARVFLSPDQPRLRVGWRLLLHATLSLVLILLFSTPLVLIMVAMPFLGLQPPTLTADRLPEAGLWGPLLALATMLALSLSTWIARRALDRRSFRSLGLHLDRYAARDLAFGFATAGLVMGSIFLMEWGMGWLRFEAWAWEQISPGQLIAGLAQGLAVFVAVGFQEELVSRGYHLQNLAESLTPGWGVFLSSAVFAVLHLRNPHSTAVSTLGILAAGYFLAFGWLRTRRLWLSIGLHIGWNFFEGTVFGFPVSGLQGFHLIQQLVEGPLAMTGGAFGPEAGLVVLPAMALGAALIWMYTRGRLNAEVQGEEARGSPR